MKVIGIAASPRKGGNTDAMLDQFLKGANSAGAETEKIHIYDKHIEFCQGCQMLCSFSDDVCPLLFSAAQKKPYLKDKTSRVK